MSSFYTLKQAKQRILSGQMVCAEFFSKETGKQTKVRVVRFGSNLDGSFRLRTINDELTEILTPDRVVFTNG